MEHCLTHFGILERVGAIPQDVAEITKDERVRRVKVPYRGA